MELSELTLFNGQCTTPCANKAVCANAVVITKRTPWACCHVTGVMYTFDDRSGIVFEVDGYDTNTPKTYPRYILTEGALQRQMERESCTCVRALALTSLVFASVQPLPRHSSLAGDGRTDKGLKIEWATVKV